MNIEKLEKQTITYQSDKMADAMELNALKESIHSLEAQKKEV